MTTRDRAGDYADGARQGAPEAVQVAARLHLVQNAHQVLHRLLERHSRGMREAARTVSQRHTQTHPDQAVVSGKSSPSPPAALATASDGSPPVRPLSKYQQHQQARRARRYALYQDVQRLRAAGGGIRHIARQLHIHRTTVLRFLAETFPEQAARPKRRSKLDPHLPYLEAQLRASQDNAMQLWRDLRDDYGYRGSRALVSRWVAAHRALCPPATVPRVRPGARPQSPAPKLPPRFRTPSVRAAVWLLTANTASLDEDQVQFVEHLQLRCPEVRLGQELIAAFLAIVRARHEARLDGWFEAVAASKLPELVSFAAGLHRDESAVRAGLRLVHSNGQVEGQINKLKLLRRSMYGRGRFDLLKHRLLAA